MVFSTQLGLKLLLAGGLLLLQLLDFEFEFIEVELALLLGSVELLAVELLQVAVLFDALLQRLLVLRSDVHDLRV